MEPFLLCFYYTNEGDPKTEKRALRLICRLLRVQPERNIENIAMSYLLGIMLNNDYMSVSHIPLSFYLSKAKPSEIVLYIFG